MELKNNPHKPATNGLKPFNLFDAESSETYNVEFRINYQTDFGQDLYIIGNIPELGKFLFIFEDLTNSV